MLKRKWKYILVVVLAPVAWLIFFAIDYNYDKKTDLGGGMTLISTIHVDRSPFTQIADSGGSAFLSFMPYSHEEMIRQKITRNRETIWVMNEEIPGLRFYCAAVSPDHHYMLVRQLVGNYWWRIHDFSTNKYLQLDIMEMRVPIGRHPHYNSFMFGRWSEDSNFVYAAEDGEEEREGKQWSYRDIYRIQASDLSIDRMEHCHQTLDLKADPLNWNNTPCAGSYK